MKTNFFSLLILLAALTFAGCQGSGTGSDQRTDDSLGAIQRSPDNTDVDRTDDTAMGQQGQQSTAALDENTRDFIMEAASGGMMEVQLGELAQQRATNQRVKDFAAMMVRDHNRANDELKNLVSGRNVNIPTQLQDKHRRKINNLQDKRGAEFDKAYMKEMVDDHQEDIRKYEEIAREANDPAIRNYANNTLTTLRMHLDSAKAIRDELTNTKSGNRNDRTGNQRDTGSGARQY